MSLSHVYQLQHELRSAESYLRFCKSQQSNQLSIAIAGKDKINEQVKKAQRQVWEIKKELAVATEET